MKDRNRSGSRNTQAYGWHQNRVCVRIWISFSLVIPSIGTVELISTVIL